jgi:hypothetical protein
MTTALPLPHGWTIHRNPFGRLVLTSPSGDPHAPIEPIRAFPISDPDHHIALCDEKGRELLAIPHLADLHPETQTLLLEELAARDFVPLITRILRVEGDGTPSVWHLLTDRGPCAITIPHDDAIRRVAPGRVLLTDAAGTRFRVDDLNRLDPASRRNLERFL